MERVPDTSVAAANRLARRWAGTIPDGSAVQSAAVLWPLLGLLAGPAAGPVRADLAEALGLPAEEAGGAATRLLEVLSAVPQLRSALGVWADRELPLVPEWVTGLPPSTLGLLSGDTVADTAALNAWAADRTGGLVPRLPVSLDGGTLLVLASALTVRTSWAVPFEDVPWRPDAGPWARPAPVAGLRRAVADIDAVGLATTGAGPLTLLRVPGAGEVDVHLVLGEAARAASEVLPAGLAVIGGPASGGAAEVVPGSGLPHGEAGPGLTVTQVPSYHPDPVLWVRTVRFDVGSGHDLLAAGRLFGLAGATDDRAGHFPGISPVPLRVSQARQQVTANFTAQGFEAAAVAAIGLELSGAIAAEPAYRARRVEVTLDRPFGFAAVHRRSGLVLVCGWVAEPEPYPGEFPPGG